MATDRRTSGTYVDDESIEWKANNRISDKLKDNVHANVTSFNRKVLLTGEVQTDADRSAVEQAIGRIDDIGWDGMKLIREINQIYSVQGYETAILAARLNAKNQEVLPMFMHNKRLQYTVRVSEPNPRHACMMLEQFGGADGELAGVAGRRPDDQRQQDRHRRTGRGARSQQREHARRAVPLRRPGRRPSRTTRLPSSCPG